MDIFSNREIAFLVWILIIAAYIGFAPRMKEARAALDGVKSTFFVWKIQSVFWLMFLYIALEVYFLSEIGVWDANQIKNTIIWTFSVALMSFFQMNSIKKDRSFFKHAVLDNLKLIAIIEFIISVYSFPLLVEIVLLPVITLIMLMAEFSKSDEKYASVKKLMDGIMTAFGLIVIGYTLYMLVVNTGEIAKEQTFYDFSIPPLLTLFFLPFIFSLLVYMTYENVFIGLKLTIEKPGHRYFAKCMAMIVFNVRIELLERWVSSLHSHKVQSYWDVCTSALRIFRMRAAERNPKPVDIRDGWSPYEAKDILLSHDLKTGYYRELYENDWFSSSPYLDIGTGVFRNNIAFYLSGDKDAVKEMKLIVNVNSPEEGGTALEKLLDTGKTLYEYATGIEMPALMQEALINGDNFEQLVDHIKISVNKEMFANKSRGGYSVNFIISNQRGDTTVP